MNEEIGRILQLLESGKISADEAERLIKAIKEPGPGGTGQESADENYTDSAAEVCLNPFRDIEQLFKTITGFYRSGLKRQRRFEQWRWHEYHRGREEERRQRSESQSVQERIRYVLSDRVFVDPDASLEDLDEIGRGLLRYELETEFGIEIPRDDLETVGTVDALVGYIEGRTAPPPKPAATAKPATPKSASRPRPSRAKKPAAKPAKSPPAG